MIVVKESEKYTFVTKLWISVSFTEDWDFQILHILK